MNQAAWCEAYARVFFETCRTELPCTRMFEIKLERAMTKLELNDLADKFYEQARDRACELVGPNAYNYDSTVERIEEELWDAQLQAIEGLA